MDAHLRYIKEYFRNSQIRWRQHALARMMERGISRKDVKNAVAEGEIIESYADSKPYPGCLVFGYSEETPIHVVVSIDMNSEIAYVITSYVPDTTHFEVDLKTRKKGGRK